MSYIPLSVFSLPGPTYIISTCNAPPLLPLPLFPQTIDISDEELGRLVESILKDDDINDDGYIDYYEFVQAQRRNTGRA